MKTDIWMPLYINDYIADTLHLSAEQSGAYLFMIMHYWKKGSLGNDINQISRIARVAPSIAQALLEEFFVHCHGQWRHKRIDAEMEEAAENKRKSTEKAKRAAAARWGNNNATSNASSNATSSPQALHEDMLEECPSPSPSPSPISTPAKTKRGERTSRFTPPTKEEVKAYCEYRKNKVDPERFIDFYTSKGWMIGKNKMKDWKAAVHTWENRNRKKSAGSGTWGDHNDVNF